MPMAITRTLVSTGALTLAVTLVLTLAGIAATATDAAAQATVVVEDWSKHQVGATGIPSGWKAQNWGSPKNDFQVVAEGADRALHMRCNDDGSTISKEIKVDIKQHPVLQWKWKATVLPKGADSRHKATDDQAAQIYVTFPRFPNAVRSRIIGYVWDTVAPVGLTIPSEKTGTVTYVIVRSGPGELGKWLSESRNVYEDYKRIYKEEPGEQVGAVSIASDCNDVHDRAESFMGPILFKKP
jgi:Protein of unknown function (DUF3047)